MNFIKNIFLVFFDLLWTKEKETQIFYGDS